MAIVIFSILMMIVSQLIRGEIRMFNTVSNQDNIENKARAAMVSLLDEVRLNPYILYYAGNDGSGDNRGVYAQEPSEEEPRCLINLQPQQEVLAGNLNELPIGTKIYYDDLAKKLWYRDSPSSAVHLIADEVEFIEFQGVTEHLLQIHLKVKSTFGEQEQELLTWIRMY